MNALASPRQGEDPPSGLDPNCAVLLGEGSRAELFRRVLATSGVHVRSPDHEEVAAAGIWIEVAGDHRHEQLAALRQISAVAADDALVISTSPILSQSEICASITHPNRLLSLVPPWSLRSRVCEIITGSEAGHRVRTTAARLARAAGWIAVRQRQGGPSALTRLYGAVIVSSWNLACRTGQPAEVDRMAQESGLPWAPLRELDGLGLQQVGGMFDRAGQFSGVPSIFRADSPDEPSPEFLANCGKDLIEETIDSGYFLTDAAQAAASLLTEGLIVGPHLHRVLTLAYGRTIAARVSRAL